MKTSHSILILAVVLSLCEGTSSRAQNSGGNESSPEAKETLEKAQAEAKQAQDRAQQELTIAKQRSQTSRRQVEATQNQLGQVAAQLAQAGSTRSAYTDRLQAIVRRAPGGGAKALVIRSGEGDPKEQGNLEEDLAVMSHIFDKAVDETLSGDRRTTKAMGINVFFAPGSSPLRSLYLEGYGALFMLNAGFPLLAPPHKTEPPKDKPPVDSAWQEARDELYGQHPVGKMDPGPVEAYNEDKVNKLKDALLEALKDASNIRDLKADDSITVCVFGGASPSVVKLKPGVKAAPVPGAEPFHGDVLRENNAPTRTSIMTIRVKKSDVDAFAKGKLSIDEFRKKARSTTYAGDLGSGSGNFSFNFSGADGGFGLPSINPPPSPQPFGGGSGGFGGSP